jgi:hypothetical protein
LEVMSGDRFVVHKRLEPKPRHARWAERNLKRPRARTVARRRVVAAGSIGFAELRKGPRYDRCTWPFVKQQRYRC